VSVLGLDPNNFSPHSFRHGGATYAFQAGVPEHLTQIHGDWRSDAYKLYLALPLSTRTQDFFSNLVFSVTLGFRSFSAVFYIYLFWPKRLVSFVMFLRNNLEV